MSDRINKLANWLKDQEIDFAFVHAVPNVYYLSGFACNPMERLLGLLVFPNDDPIMVCPQLEAEQVTRTGWEHEIIGVADDQNPWELISASIAAKGIDSIKKFAVEEEEISYARVNQLKNLYPEAPVISMGERLSAMRLIKDEAEIEKMREAARLADYAIEVGVKALKAGVTEVEVAAHITYQLRKEGIRGISNFPLVLFGEKSSLPHGSAGDVSLKDGDFVLFDLGVEVDGYYSDITRTFVFGSVDEKQKEVYHTVLDSNEAAINATTVGTRLGDIDEVSRNVIAGKGYGEYYIHRVGHGLGLEVHEYPSMHGKNNELAQAGMTFTIEPGIYIPGFGGVRIEDDVLVTKSGPEVLTKYPKHLQVING